MSDDHRPGRPVTTDAANAVLADEGARSRLARLLVPMGLALLLGALCFARRNPITGFTPGTDQGVYLYIAHQLLNGAPPYRDVFDNKGPLLYLINALGLILGGGSFWGVYVLEYCLLAVSTVLTYLLLKLRTGWLIAALATLFFVLQVAHIAVGDHELFRKPKIEPRRPAWFVAGLLGAGAFFLKPTGLGFWAALLLTVVLVCLRTGEWRRWLPRLSLGVAGAALGSALFLAYLSVVGALRPFAADFLGFNFLYVGTNSMAARLSSIGYGAGKVGHLAMAAVLLSWLLTLRRILRRGGKRTGGDLLALFAIVWLPVEVALSATSGYSREQYYFPWLLPATLVLAFGLVELSKFGRRASAGGRFPLGWAAALLAVVAFAGLCAPTVTLLHDLGGSLIHYHYYATQKRPAAEVAAYVDAHTTPGDTVLVWGGYNATINFLAKRSSPTPYVMQECLYWSSWADKHAPEFLRDLEAHPPALILDTSPSYGPESGYGHVVPPLAATSNPWASNSVPLAATWAAVYAYVRVYYRSDGRLEFPPYAPGWPVYVRR